MDSFGVWWTELNVLCSSPSKVRMAGRTLSRALHQGDGAEESSAIKISQQHLIGFSFDVRRHSPWDEKTVALFLRELYSISASKSPTTAIQSSQWDTFVLCSFHLNSEVLCSFYRLDRNISNAAGIIRSVNWKDFRGEEGNDTSSDKNN